MTLVSLCASLSGARVVRADDSEYGASASVRADGPVGSTDLSVQQATERPGALGEPARALLDAPGAARSSFLGSELVLWGAAPSESRTYVDGVEIPFLFHPSGLRTTVHPALIDHVSVSPGALPAEYGRALGGAVDVTTRAPSQDARATARIDGIDSSLSAEGGTHKLRALAGLRYGYFDRVLTALSPRSQSILAVPSHQDGVARVEHQLAPDTRLRATWLGARDRVDLRTDTGRQRRANDFHVFSLRLDRRYDDGARIQITSFAGLSSSDDTGVFARVPLLLRRRSVSYGVRADYTRTEGWYTVRLGLDARGTREQTRRYGTLGLPAREGDVRVFGQVPIDVVDRDDTHVSNVNVAPWASLSLRFRGLTLVPGIRLESYVLSVARSFPEVAGIPALGHDALHMAPEPRVTLSYRVQDWLVLEARTGIHHQAPDALDLSAAFGTPTLSPSRARQSFVGLRADLLADISLEVGAFERSLRGLAIRTADRPARIAHALDDDGRGRTHGLSFSLRREATRTLFFSTSYTLSRSERTLASGATRLSDYDQTHVLSALLGFTLGHFVVSARLRTASGAPRTAVLGRYLDTKTGREQPLFGALNQLRLSTYVALDLHAEYTFLLRALKLSTFLDVLNATDRVNVEDYGYSAAYTRRRDVTSIPIVAMIGASLSVGHE